jgi:hypothetical protein
MTPSLDRIENEIARERGDLDAWLAESYAGIEDQRYYGERDASYDGWGRIESIVGRVFDAALTQRLSAASVESLLFFISRSDELGRIIAWLSNEPPFSWSGNLSYPDFLFLSEQAVIRPDDFCDYQLASCYQKCGSLGDCEIDVLRRFFQKRDSYTRRTVLHVFEHFRMPEVVDLATALWQSDDCEFAKLSCLHALKTMPDARHIFDAYLREYRKTFDVDAEEYRQSHIRQLAGPENGTSLISPQPLLAGNGKRRS